MRKDPYLMPPIEREKYPKLLSTPQVHEMFGGQIGINRLRDVARRRGRELGITRHGNKFLWDRDRVLAYMSRQFASGGILSL